MQHLHSKEMGTLKYATRNKLVVAQFHSLRDSDILYFYTNKHHEMQLRGGCLLLHPQKQFSIFHVWYVLKSLKL